MAARQEGALLRGRLATGTSVGMGDTLLTEKVARETEYPSEGGFWEVRLQITVMSVHKLFGYKKIAV